MLTNKSSKFLWYKFNDYLGRNERPLERMIRHTITLKEVGLLAIKRGNWQYFAQKMVAITENPILTLVMWLS